MPSGRLIQYPKGKYVQLTYCSLRTTWRPTCGILKISKKQ
nr:MAG TPA: hypothetical protein [Bacteriophage sp.]